MVGSSDPKMNKPILLAGDACKNDCDLYKSFRQKNNLVR